MNWYELNCEYKVALVVQHKFFELGNFFDLHVAMENDEFLLQTALEFYRTVILFYSFMYNHHFVDCTFISSKLHTSTTAIIVCNMCNI